MIKAGLSLRDEIDNMEDTMPWRTNVSDLSINKVNIGESLEILLKIILARNNDQSTSFKVNWLKLSIGQDIVCTKRLN